MSEVLLEIGEGLWAVVERIGSSELAVDPYPYYSELRGRARAFHSDGRWLFVSHRDCSAVTKDQRWIQRPDLQGLPDGAARRTREVVTEAFSARSVRRLEPRIEAHADSLIDAAIDVGETDFIESVACQLSSSVSCEILGIPMSDRELLATWTDDPFRSIDPVGSLASDDDIDRRSQAQIERTAYLSSLMSQRRHDPRDDLLSSLVTKWNQRLDKEEKLAVCAMAMFVGYETVVDHLGLALLALLNDPDQFRLLQRRPDIVGVAVEELLRYDSPAPTRSRVAIDDIEVNGYRVKRGETAVSLVAAANHDPDAFDDPDLLDLTRQRNPHLTFSNGQHDGVGATLARAQSRAVLGALARRVSSMDLAGSPVHRQTVWRRGLRKLPIRLYRRTQRI